jgi:hypothetical protein
MSLPMQQPKGNPSSSSGLAKPDVLVSSTMSSVTAAALLARTVNFALRLLFGELQASAQQQSFLVVSTHMMAKICHYDQ